MILPIAQAVEESIIEQGLELGKVSAFSHNRAKESKEIGANITLPGGSLRTASHEVMKENQSQLIKIWPKDSAELRNWRIFLKATLPMY
jgi:hypothetical protein